ncbi:MAG: sulfite exporter TauE/SafE family protein [Oscillospiraceae bacterium]|jgi:sulfite exporter TauE/SafE/copper chaperone CopZ|nr:sulfite exporter TauE/SafE family protein [Oscillospiraceae bacterium]
MAIKSQKLHIGGMNCVNCQTRIERKLRNTAGVKSCKVSYNEGAAEISYESELISLKEITAAIQSMDYKVIQSADGSNTGRAAGLLLIIVALFWGVQHFGLLSLLTVGRTADSAMSYGMLFVIGLLTSVHCVAMCGGINLSQCIGGGIEPAKGSVLLPSFLYNLGRVISYTVIGVIIGGIGSAFNFTSTMQGALKLIAGVFMVIMGINMLGIFPSLRKLSPRMPASISKRLNAEKPKASSPLIIGLLNGLMPCGPLQSIQIYALSTGSPLKGGLAMLLFSLGTVPLMFGLGALSRILSKKFTHKAITVGAVLVAVMGLAMLSQGWNLAGLKLPMLPAISAKSGSGQAELTSIQIEDGVQLINSTLKAGRQYPNITVQAGVPVKWTITAAKGDINGCNNRIIIKELDIEYQFKEGANVIEFTPTKTDDIRYTCWMGMISGHIYVVDGTGEASANAEAAPEPTDAPNVYNGGGCC